MFSLPLEGPLAALTSPVIVLVAARSARQPEVRYLDECGREEQQVTARQVAVHEPLVLQVLHP